MGVWHLNTYFIFSFIRGDENMINQIKKYIASNASNKLSSFNSKLIKTNSPIYGVRTPLLRDIAKKIASGVYKLFLEECDNSSYEITLIEGFVIGYAKMSLEKKILLYG